MYDPVEMEERDTVKWQSTDDWGVVHSKNAKSPTQMLEMRVIAGGYTGPGHALMASALIWHQAKHSIPLTFISLFYTMCVYVGECVVSE